MNESIERIVEILRQILLLPGVPMSEVEPPQVPPKLLTYTPMSTTDAMRYYGRELHKRGRHEEAAAMFHAAIKGSLEDLLESLNGLGIVHWKTGRTREALAVYHQALDLADALDVETWTVAFNASNLLLEIEKEECIPWAPQAYDRWMRRLNLPLELEAGRDDWIPEAFEAAGRPEYAAKVRALLQRDFIDDPTEPPVDA